MLRNTFIHIPRIGKVKERWLWDNGFLEWSDVLSGDRPAAWSEERWGDLHAHVERSERALGENDARYFERRLQASEGWRICNSFPGRTAYVDIETTGLGGMASAITVIGVYDGGAVHQFIDGINLGAFEEFIGGFDLLVTYNGKAFDIPILKSRFGRARLERKGHVDLRYVFASLGFKGGLKGIEKALGITRPEGVVEMDGYAAVICWQRYKRGYVEFLDILCRYNAEDVRNLKPLAEMACAMARQKLVGGTPLSRSQGVES